MKRSLFPFPKSKRGRGQALPFLLVMIVILVISWSMMVNIAKLLKDRMMMQNAADNAALSVAVYRARVLNRLGYLNYLLGALLYDGPAGLTLAGAGVPPPGVLNYFLAGTYDGPFAFCSRSLALATFMFFWDSQKKVASLPDMGHTACSGMDRGFYRSDKTVRTIQTMIDGLVRAQDSLRIPYPGLASHYANEIAKRQELNARGEPCGADGAVVVSGGSLGLERNRNGIDYYTTLSACFSFPPNTAVPTGGHLHQFASAPRPSRRSKESWLFADRNRFWKKHRIVVMAIKRGESASNKGYPLLGKWLGIKWPTIITVASAAVYNRNGPMFPLDDRERPSDKISPVLREYEKARGGGWDAHLIPVRQAGIRH